MPLQVVLEDGSEGPAYKSKEWLEEMYWGREMTIAQVAEAAGCISWTVRKWMVRLGVERRGGGPPKRPPDKVVDGVLMHWCGGHKEYHPATDFNKSSSNPSGLQDRCKAWWRGSNREYRAKPKVSPKEKMCGICGETKPASAFDENRMSGDNLMPWCKDCFAKDIRIRTFQREHGIDLSDYDYDAELAQQGGGCAICSKTPKEEGKALAVHHRAKRVCGILCLKCNTGLGDFKHDPQIIRNAMAYVEKGAQYGPIKQFALLDRKELLKAQGYKCAICGAVGELELDHDHATKEGLVRGFLCGSCNRGLGKFDDDLERMQVAVDYLEKWEETPQCNINRTR